MSSQQKPISSSRRSSLGWRMLGFALLAGGVFSLFNSAVYLTLQYRHSVKTLGQQVENLIESHRGSLSMSLYRLDENQLRAELEDLRGHFGLLRLQVSEPSAHSPLRVSVGEIAGQSVISLLDTLWVSEGGQKRALGLLSMDVDADWPMRELRREAWMTLFAHMASLLALALIVIGLAHFGVTRHLVEITRQLEALGFDRLERRVMLKRFLPHRSADEIDRLRDALNALLQRLEDGRRERDQSELKRMEIEKRQESTRKLEALGNLAGGIAHDINNILGIILLQTEMARDALDSKSASANKLHIVLQAVDRAKEVVRQILVFSRNVDGQRQLQNVTSTVKDALVLLRASLLKKSHLRSDLEDDCGLIYAEPADIQQIILNVGLNAFQAMEKKGGQFTVALRLVHLEPGDLADRPDAKPGLHAMLTLSDTGPGMEKAVLDRIFEPYFTTKESGKGTGLGLAVVHGIVSKLGGHILVHSEMGRGTTFRVLLPVKEGRVDGPDEIPPMPTGLGERVLLAEDEPLLREAVQEMLRGLGYQVFAYSDGRQALEALQRNPAGFDLLLTDLAMPVMGGVDLAEAALVLRPDLPIGVCTGFAHADDFERLQVRGVQIVSGKPFLRYELAVAIHNLLRKQNEKVLVG